MTQSDYVTACCLGKRIVIMDGLKDILRQQKAIGNNLSQLTVLANMGIDPRTAHEAVRQLAGYFEGCEVLVCTHTDREHIYSHCIINSVNFDTGKKVHMADEQIQALRARNDQICEKLGLPKFQRDEQQKSSGMSTAEYYPAAKGESWKLELMRVIDECIRYAGSREEFLALLRAEGYGAT